VTRVEITDAVVAALRDALDHEAVDHPLNRGAVQHAAWDQELDGLAEFIASADASTYYEALRRAGVDPKPGGDNEGGYDHAIDG
jgi:hypothetical protein